MEEDLYNAQQYAAITLARPRKELNGECMVTSTYIKFAKTQLISIDTEETEYDQRKFIVWTITDQEEISKKTYKGIKND